MKISPFKTIASECEFTLKEKRSTFIAKVFHVSTADEIDNILKRLKKEFYDSSHQCYAYKLMNGKTKFSDAGEPSGTAGIRILNAIEHYQLFDCLILVIRYFGGTKLGVGPLGKAYYNSAERVLSYAKISVKYPYYPVDLIIKLSSIDKFIQYIYSNGIKILKREYDYEAKLTCLIPYDSYAFQKKMIVEHFKSEILQMDAKKVIFE
jgi:uncharacterized YigZ family protein